MIKNQLLLLFTSMIIAGCCECNSVESWPSPDQQKCAIIYDCACGATTGFARRVAIRNCGDVPKDPSDDDGVVCVLDGKIPIQIQWLNSQTLLTTTSLDKRIRFVEKLDGYSVQYYEWPRLDLSK